MNKITQQDRLELLKGLKKLSIQSLVDGIEIMALELQRRIEKKQKSSLKK